MYYIDKANERHEIIFETIWHKSNANSLIVLPYGDYDSVRRGEADEIRFDMAHPLEGISMTYLRCFFSL